MLPERQEKRESKPQPLINIAIALTIASQRFPIIR